MVDTDDLRSGLARAAALIDPGDAATTRAAAHALAHRRRTRRRAVGVVGAAALIVGGVSVAVVSSGDDDPGVLVGVDPPPTVPVTSVPEDSAPVRAPESTEPASTVSIAPVVADVIGGVGVPVSGPGIAMSNWSFGPSIIPWRDGFLAFGTDLASGITARFTTDGGEWESLDIVAPGGRGLRGAAGGGDHIAGIVTGGSSNGASGVYTTTDLVTWNEHAVERTQLPFDLPPFVTRDLRPWEVVAGQAGWAVRVTETSGIVVEQLLPPEVVEAMQAPDSGFGMSVRWDDVAVEIIVESGASLGSYGEATTYRYPWSDLGVEPDVVDYILRTNNGADSWWVAPWDGGPVRAGDDPIVVTDDGFVALDEPMRFSEDGTSWVDGASLADVFPSTLVGAVRMPYGDGFLLVNSPSEFDASVVRVDARGSSAVPVEVPGLPVRVGAIGAPANSPAALFDGRTIEIPPVVAEHDGYRWISTGQPQLLELVDMATGEVLVAEDQADAYDPDDPQPSSFEYTDDGFTVTDPATGQVIVTFPNDVLAAAYAERGITVLDPATPDLHLLATRDGSVLFLQDLADEVVLNGPLLAVANGDVVLTAVGDTWTRYDLR